jgi:hypothetical protein
MNPQIPKFEKKEELYAYLKTNKDDLIYQKKSEMKRADDDFGFHVVQIQEGVNKAQGNVASNPDVIKVRAIINTTMVRDSHKDVHIDGLWKKTLQENKRIKHLQEHEMAFDKIIADKDDLNVYTRMYSWKDLGYDFEGETQALVFDSTIKSSRNPVMFKEYSNGNVDNHSVGMGYVKMALAINSEDEDFKEEKAEFDKHIEKILNKEEVKEDGFFWAVYEAKAYEGSAVPMGSNPMTPTIPIKNHIFETENKLETTIKEWLTNKK